MQADQWRYIAVYLFIGHAFALEQYCNVNNSRFKNKKKIKFLLFLWEKQKILRKKKILNRSKGKRYCMNVW